MCSFSPLFYSLRWSPLLTTLVRLKRFASPLTYDRLVYLCQVTPRSCCKPYYALVYPQSYKNRLLLKISVFLPKAGRN